MPLPKTILIGPSTFAKYDSTPLEKIKAAGFSIRPNPVGRKMNKGELLEALHGVVGVIAGLEVYSPDVLASCSLKVVSRCGAGMDSVDLVAAKARKIKVCSTPNAPTTAVAELTVGALIILLRKVAQMNELVHSGKWEKYSGPQLEGKTVAIIGLGRIGLKVAEYLRVFGVRILGVDPICRDLPQGIELCSLTDALRQSDIVSIHASGSTEIIGIEQFSLMKKGVYLANAGRGGLINEEALVASLRSGTVAGAWLDAFAAEPYVGPLMEFQQVLLTPHIGYSSDEARRKMEMEAADNLLIALREGA